jgi:hypothetical protein
MNMEEPERTRETAFAWLTKGQESWCTDTDRPTTEYATDFVVATVEQMGLSGTGMNPLVFKAVADYLQDLTADPVPALYSYEGRADAAQMALAAEIAAGAGLVDYGVSLRHAWLSDAGRAWLEDFERYLDSRRRS